MVCKNIFDKSWTVIVDYKNWVLVVKIQSCLNKLKSTFNHFLFQYHFINALSKYIIPLKPKASSREYSNKIVRIILVIREADKSYTQIAYQVKFPNLSVVHIIHQATQT